MAKNKKIFAAASLACFVAFVALAVCLKFIDVRKIGPLASEVGFAGLNGAFFGAFGYNAELYSLTEKAGYLPFAVVAVFAGVGVYQLITRKSFTKVDCELYILASSYVVAVLAYLFFETVVVNYRPVVLDKGLEASFPSSHTMLAAYICASAAFLCFKYLKGKFSVTAAIALGVLGAFICVGRALSGVHWLTDILGGLLLAAALFFAFVFFTVKFKKE